MAVCPSRHENTSVLIRWSGNATIIKLKEVYRFDSKPWMGYIYVHLHKSFVTHIMLSRYGEAVLSYGTSNVQILLIAQSCITDKMYQSCFSPKLQSAMNEPCGVVDYRSSIVSDHSWFISVHKSFIINITVAKGYVPYSDDCLDNGMIFYDGFEMMGEHKLETFCGHMLLETVYTRFNKARIHIKVQLQMSQVFYVYSYTVHPSGYAFKFSMVDLPALQQAYKGQDNLEFPDKPSWILF